MERMRMGWLALVVVGLGVKVAYAQPPTAEDVRAALAAQHGEPDVREVVDAVLRHASADPAAVEGAMERARLSGLLPTVRVGLRQGTGYDVLTRQTDTTGTSSLTGSQDLSFIGQLTFRLDRLLYAADERALLRERRASAERRVALIAEIVRLYYERRRLLVEDELGAAPDLAREARIAEIEALFEVMSDGEIHLPPRHAREEADLDDEEDEDVEL